jgi:glycosyltransferase involved in cell wall biosynthesis
VLSRLRRLAPVRFRRALEVHVPDGLAEVMREGPAAPAPAADPERSQLSVAFVVPSFRRASGGHATIAAIVRALEARGHACSVWIIDDDGLDDPDAADRFRSWFGPIRGPVATSFGAWAPADVAVATAWQTVPRTLRLPGAHARAYLVQDHEPDFYPASCERQWSEWTYGQGLHCIAASQWLVDVLGARYGASASRFDLAVDHGSYRPVPVSRRDDLVLFYSRAATPRRGVPLGLMALEELHRRRPGVEIALYGDEQPVRTAFPSRQLGLLARDALAELYSTATVGLALSLTNPSLIPLEMLACGLPCVDLATESMLASHGGSPIALAEPAPMAVCEAVEALLDAPERRSAVSEAGREWVRSLTWDRAAEQVEEGLRTALRRASS